jgi:hypothetical protein
MCRWGDKKPGVGMDSSVFRLRHKLRDSAIPVKKGSRFQHHKVLVAFDPSTTVATMRRISMREAEVMCCCPSYRSQSVSPSHSRPRRLTWARSAYCTQLILYKVRIYGQHLRLIDSSMFSIVSIHSRINSHFFFSCTFCACNT